MAAPRPTPFDLCFAELALQRFSELKADVVAHPGRLDRAAFAKLPAVQRLLAEIGGGGPDAAEPEALNEYLQAVYAAFAFWDAGERVFAVTRERLEPALGRELGPLPAVPYGAIYVQLPERWFWARIAPDEPHEPVDGLFVTGPATPPAEGDEVAVLAVLGLRPERGGFSQVARSAAPAEFSAARALVRRPPFAPELEGGERAGFRSIASPAELLHLAHVALQLLDR